MTFALELDRRRFLEGAAVLGLAAAMPSLAFAQTVPVTDLMKEGALPDVWLGSADAPVTVIEYASMTARCGFRCANSHSTRSPRPASWSRAAPARTSATP